MADIRVDPSRPGLGTDFRAGVARASVHRRRSTPHILLGAVLVVVSALAFAVTAMRVDPRTPVLAVAAAVPAGHVLTDADLVVLRIVPDQALAVVPATQRSSVVGRSVRLPLAAHTLLAQQVLGPAAWPPPGQSVIAVSVKPGRLPDGLSAGAPVLVLLVATPSTADGSGSEVDQRAQATVVALGTADGTGTRPVTLLLTTADAVRVAASSGEVALVVQGRAG